MRGGVDTTQVMTETVEDKVSHSIVEPLQLKRRYLQMSRQYLKKL